jgi:hypothetical protein
MLGLGASVVYSPVVSEPSPEATYESDFTSGVDGFAGYSIDEDIFIVGNVDGEPSEDSKNDVLRATLSDDAETNGGIFRNMASKINGTLLATFQLQLLAHLVGIIILELFGVCQVLKCKKVLDFI